MSFYTGWIRHIHLYWISVELLFFMNILNKIWIFFIHENLIFLHITSRSCDICFKCNTEMSSYTAWTSHGSFYWNLVSEYSFWYLVTFALSNMFKWGLYLDSSMTSEYLLRRSNVRNRNILILSSKRSKETKMYSHYRGRNQRILTSFLKKKKFSSNGSIQSAIINSIVDNSHCSSVIILKYWQMPRYPV